MATSRVVLVSSSKLLSSGRRSSSSMPVPRTLLAAARPPVGAQHRPLLTSAATLRRCPRLAPAPRAAAAVPWLPPQQLKADQPGNSTTSAKVAAWATAVTGFSVFPATVGVFSYIFWHQSAFQALLGSKLQTLMLMLMPVFMGMAYGGALLQHEYEGFQLNAGWEDNKAVDRSKAGNRWLRELMGRSVVVFTCCSMLAFCTAALGQTPAVMAVAAAAAVAFAGPYQPVLEPVVNSKKAVLVSTWVFAASLPVMALYAWALWQLLGTKGVAVFLWCAVGSLGKTLAEVINSPWLHPVVQLVHVTHMPLLLYFISALM